MLVEAFEGQIKSYLYLMGICLERPLQLSPRLMLRAASCNPLPDDMIDSIMKKGSQDETDLGVLIASLRKTAAELVICAVEAEELVVLTWNAQTAIVLLSALLNYEIYCHVQVDVPAECFSSDARVNIIQSNRLYVPRETHRLTEEENGLLETYFLRGWNLLEDDRFAVAANALWSYRMNLRPSTQLAVIWSGIEALFNIESELVFRISTLAALFLGEGKEKQLEIKKLYSARSKAVHEGRQPDGDSVVNSASLLHSLVVRCVMQNSMPTESSLLFS